MSDDEEDEGGTEMAGTMTEPEEEPVAVTVEVLAPTHWREDPHVRPEEQQPPPREAGQEVSEEKQAVAVPLERVTVVVLVT